MKPFRERWHAKRKWRAVANELGRIGRFLNNLVGMGLDITPNSQGGLNFEVRQTTSHGGSGGGAIPCKIVSYADGVYTVDVYGSGIHNAKTSTGELDLLGVHLGEQLEAGDWVMGHATTLSITGGSE